MLTISKHLFEHCLVPSGVQGYMLSCSCISAGYPFGDSPFLNCPVKKTPQVHHVWLTFNLRGSIGIGSNDFSLFHSNSMGSFVAAIQLTPNKQKKTHKAAKKFMIDVVFQFNFTQCSLAQWKNVQ